MIQGMSGLKRKVKKAKVNLDRKPDKAVKRNLEAMRADARANVAHNGNIYRTTVLNSFRMRSFNMGGNNRRQELVNEAPHANYLEFGTGARNIGKTPETRFKAPKYTPGLVYALYNWIVFKGITSYRGMDDHSLAEAIAQEIAKHGTYAYPYMHPAYRELETSLKGDVRKSVRDSFR